MNMLRIFVAILSLSSVLGQTRIAVVEFESAGVSQDESRALVHRLVNELTRTGHFTVLEKAHLDQIIEEQMLQESGLTSEESLAEIGALANVEQIVGGSVSKLGSLYSISARLIDVETRQILRTALFDHEGSVEELILYGMADIASQLSGKTETQSTVVSVRTKSSTEPAPPSASLAGKKEGFPRDLLVDIAVDLRKGSNPQSEIILEIPRGDTITVLKPVEAGVWLANYRGHTGYIVTKTRERDAPQKALSHKPNPKEFRQRSLEYLKEHHPEAAQKVKSRLAQLRKQYPLTITLRKGVIIYAKPQTDVIAALSLRGDQLKLIKHAGDGYIRVSYQGKIGYVWVLDLQLK